MRRASALLILCSILLAGPAWADGPYMKTSDVRVGMKGVLRTVMKGTKIEDFPVEVVDVLRKMRPGQDVILIKLLGEKIRKTGLVQGMSGSPVYIDGKLVGALALGWSMMREPMAGVTPIAQMMRVERKEEKDVPRPVLVWKRGSTLPVAEFIQKLLSPRSWHTTISPGGFSALRVPISVNGFSTSGKSALSESLRGFGVSVVAGVGGGAGAADVPDDLKLEPGSVLTIQLIKGDWDASAMGTVTEVVGKRVYGFGHSMFNGGKVNLPMATGNVNAVIATNNISFKLGSALKSVGTLRIDHRSGIVGDVGKVPDMIKMSVKVRRKDLVGDSDFNFEVIDDPGLTLSIVNAIVRGTLFVSGETGNEVRIKVTGSINIEGHDPVPVESVYGGPRAPIQATGVLVNPLGYILHNPFEKLKIRSIDLTTEVIPGDPRAVIRYVELDRKEYRPGDEMDVAVTFALFRKNEFVRHFNVKIPDDVPEGQLTLIVCDSDTDMRMESREMSHRFRPTDVEDVLKFFRRRWVNTDIVFRLSRAHAGVALDGKELPKLPGSVISVLGKQSPLEVSSFARFHVERQSTEFVIVGQQQLRVKINKKLRSE